ncbi:acyltransferase [Roseospira marina]|uniref:Acyltransferase n=1 Tax=Roseospira marina TaxID=140057 RepID=A0A5M6IFU8_9PROT|nr:acyltransferase family protein [Roseospira marina]KAA5606458.1 acyltransferase [Roseospira marina]MBB4314126.1 peptidoglycan/LPS O-acetylase OafA/YrhL [Roseospira marina]MBB5087287.1 peptidoglycan/LPS O-acetylase OafA/YrhL [Roseospira marina]
MRPQERQDGRGYLTEVDGLRALAVLSVMAFHLKDSLLPGGFTGVDVFFVISGYVVTKSLFDTSHLNLWRFITNFYARRIVRIIPALLLCLLVVTLLTVLFIPRSWLSGATENTGLAAFFGFSNVALVLFNDGYFAPRVEFNPFVHTWSLGVEEQFYLVFPAIFFLWARMRDTGDLRSLLARATLPALAIASLGAAWWMGRTMPEAAYYLLFSRFWELAAGALLFKAHAQGRMLPTSPRTATLVLGAGMAVAAAGFVFSAEDTFPWPWAFLPVVGTGLMIAAVARPECNGSPLHGLLRHPVAVYLGKTSYSLYLWHWPVYVLFRWTVGLDTVPKMAAAVAVTLASAFASYHLVENALRRSPVVTRRPPLLRIAGGLVCIGLVYGAANHLFRGQMDYSLSVTRDIATWHVIPALPSRPEDRAGKPFADRSLFAVGDSHALAYGTLFSDLQEQLGVKTVTFHNARCRIVSLMVKMVTDPECQQTLEHILSTIEAQATPGDVVFFASLRVFRLADQWATFDQAPVRHWMEAGQAERDGAVDQASAIIERLNRHGLHVIVDAPKPILPSPPFRCSDWFNRSNPICKGGLSIDRAFLEEWRAPIVASLATLQERFPDGLTVWDPFPVLCPGEVCHAFDGETPLFFDGDHLSPHGNQVLYPAFVSVLEGLWAPEDTRVSGTPVDTGDTARP